MNIDDFSKEQVDTLHNILTEALRSNINLLRISMFSDVKGVITLSAFITDDVKMSFDIIDTGDAVCYIFSLAEKNDKMIQYMGSTKEEYSKFFSKFLEVNPYAKRS
jgi:regulator of RNase E activity RraB